MPLAFDVSQVVAELDANPQLWDQHTLRKKLYVHGEMSDIWVRYNAFENFTGDMAAFNAEHESVWYPAIEKLPALKKLLFDLMWAVEGERLGGVLITRIPPGKGIAPHTDDAWHARYYSKIAVQLKSAPGQAFCFEDESLSAEPGEVYVFRNEFTHWVVNDSEQERMTLIVCIKTESPICHLQQ